MSFSVSTFSASVEDVGTGVWERPGALQYVTSRLRAYADVVCTVDAWQTHTIGFVSAVSGMSAVHQYTSGTAEWELPSVDVAPVPDAGVGGDGFPWAGGIAGVRRIAGPVSRVLRSVGIDHGFVSVVPWAVPVPGHTAPSLERIARSQELVCWLVARNDVTGTVTPLRTVRWTVEVSLDVDPVLPLGQRATCRAGPSVEARVSEGGEIPEGVLDGPVVDDVLQMVWYPDQAEPLVLVAARSPRA